CAEDAPTKLREQVKKLIEEKDYLLACELLQSHLRDRWSELVRAEFGQKANPSPLHQALVALRQRIILTTNFDKLIENAWNNLEEEETHFREVISSIDGRIFRVL